MASILNTSDLTKIKSTLDLSEYTDEAIVNIILVIQSILEKAGVSPYFDEEVTITEQLQLIQGYFDTSFSINSITSIVDNSDTSNSNLYDINTLFLKYDNKINFRNKYNSNYYLNYCDGELLRQQSTINTYQNKDSLRFHPLVYNNYNNLDLVKSFDVTYKTGYLPSQDPILEQIVKKLWFNYKDVLINDPDAGYNPNIKKKAYDNTSIEFIDAKTKIEVDKLNLDLQLKSIEPFVKLISPKSKTKLTIA